MLLLTGFSLLSRHTQGLFALTAFSTFGYSPASAQDVNGCWSREDPNTAGDDVVYTPLGDNWVPSSLCFPGIDDLPTRTSASLSTPSPSTLTVTFSATHQTTITSSTVTTSTTTTTLMVIPSDLVLDNYTPYIRTTLRHHNVHRANHSVPALAWSESLASSAQSIAETCIFQHNVTANGGGYGQNIMAGIPADQMGVVVTDWFYNPEMAYYRWYGAEPDFSDFSHWGHFSQLVWRSTTEVGCATVDCSSHQNGLQNAGGVPPYFTVCNYKPPGNYVGMFSQNMGSPLGFPSVDSTYVCRNKMNC